MGAPRTASQEIVGIEVARTVVRGVRLQPERNEIVGVGEVAFAAGGLDRDGVIDPGLVGPVFDTLLVRMGVRDRSQIRVGMSIGPRNAGVGSGPAMADWLEAQAQRLHHPLVCSGGLGIAFVPIRAVDQAVKSAFDVGVDLIRVDLAPVAAVRAVGEQIDEPICLGSGRGWQARMRDFEVLEAMERPEVGPDEPVMAIGRDGRGRVIDRYGWIDLSTELIRSGRVDSAMFAPAVGAALGVLYDSPANLLDGKVIGSRSQPARIERSAGEVVESQAHQLRVEQTLQLGVIDVDDGDGSEYEAVPADVASTGSPVGPVVGRGASPEIARDDPINLFSPDTDEANILGQRRFRFGLPQFLMLLVLVAVALGAYYRFG